MDGLASYFLIEGYPVDALHAYFLTLTNSTFDQWHGKNLGVNLYAYKIDISRLSASGAVLDQDKLKYICKNIIASYSTDRLYDLIYCWAEKYDKLRHTALRVKHRKRIVRM